MRIASAFLTISTLAGLFFSSSDAEALKVNFEPSITFRNSYVREYPQPPRIVRHYHEEVHPYRDPYTGQVFYYSYPVMRDYVEYPSYYPHRYHSTGTDVGFKFKFK